MKFVVRIDYCSEFVASWTEHVPVEYDSIEALYVDLNQAILDGKKDRTLESIVIAGKEFQLHWFDRDDPEPVCESDIILLDTWFDNAYGVGQ